MKQSFTDDTINELKIGQKMRQKNRNNKKENKYKEIINKKIKVNIEKIQKQQKHPKIKRASNHIKKQLQKKL